MLQNLSHPNLTLLSHGSTLSLPNNLLLLSSHKQFAFPLPPINNPEHTLLHRCLNPTIFASSIKKSRTSRKGRSNADLCNEIWEFVSAVGIPEGHVPSLKEFSQHGRQDLANIVRRRGYKFIKELLETSTKYDRNESDTEEVLIETHVMRNEYKHESPGQDEKVEDTAQDVFSSSEVSVEQNHLNGVNGANIDSSSSSDNKNFMALESSINSSLQEKVAKFFQNGELDTFEDDDFGNLNEIEADDDKGFVEIEKVRKESSSLGEKHSEWVLGRADIAKVLNGSVSPRPASVNNTLRDEFSSDRLLSADCDEELDVETRKRENQIEINHLKLMLHQRELELSRLKEQIEKEQLALSILQTKAETEISKAQKLILEKDAELHSAEEKLSGLEEVQIQFWGDGETVEVAGSFNGWHHRITMEPQPLSSISDPIGSRKSRLWTTVLWLYPGIYEIKFIVDGQWRIDPQRELVTQGTIQNNILRVGR